MSECVSGRDDLPQRERDVLDAVARLGATRAAELGHARLRGLEAHDAFEVGDRDQQWSVGVAVSQHRVDLEDRVRRIPRVDARAVVDDPLEDRQRPEPHETMLADGDL
jgi:hypothetical protein